MGESSRLPDFVIIGAMKSATTSLYRWLDEQPEVFVAHPKETNFFTDHWGRGVEWYSEQFASAEEGLLLGEASVNYMNPELVAVAAERMAGLLPEAHLICALRDPVERIRSHYRHEVQRRREARSLLEALEEPGNPYIGHSSYGTCLQPYIERFPRQQILIVRFEDLVGSLPMGWPTTLDFLSLSDRPLPGGAHNVSSEKAQWRWAMAAAKQNGLVSFRQISRLPKPVRRAGRAVFARGGRAYERKLDASRVPIPDAVLEPMWEDVSKLETWLGISLWPPVEEARSTYQ